MKKKGRKIKEIADELGVSTRFVIDQCHAHDMPVQNSITRLTRQQEQQLLSWTCWPPRTAVAVPPQGEQPEEMRHDEA